MPVSIRRTSTESTPWQCLTDVISLSNRRTSCVDPSFNAVLADSVSLTSCNMLKGRWPADTAAVTAEVADVGYVCWVVTHAQEENTL